MKAAPAPPPSLCRRLREELHEWGLEGPPPDPHEWVEWVGSDPSPKGPRIQFRVSRASGDGFGEETVDCAPGHEFRRIMAAVKRLRRSVP